ncbi:MAG: dethiobiotin synthase [Nitrospiraceae bacterium]
MTSHHSPTQGRGISIVGTDTGVGKTLVAAALVTRLRHDGMNVGVMKPVETGVEPHATDSDAHRLREAAQTTDDLTLVSPYRYARAVAPHAAAEGCSQKIDIGHIVDCYKNLATRHAVTVVEGVGGLLVPLTEKQTLRDLMEALAIPTIVVGRSGLGGINHALLTLEALRTRHLPVAALVLNRTIAITTDRERDQEQTTVDALRRRIGIPLYGPLPYQPSSASNWHHAVADLANDSAIAALTRQLVSA